MDEYSLRTKSVTCDLRRSGKSEIERNRMWRRSFRSDPSSAHYLDQDAHSLILGCFLVLHATISPTAHSMSSSQASGLPDETLHRILTQIQLSLTQSTRQLSLVKAQKAAREREKKGVELTRLGIKEETDLGAKSWRGVGKM